MSMSDDNTNELDSYGVWVKHSSGDESLPEVNENPEVTPTDDSLDLPDFDDSDFSDMFKDDSQFSTDAGDFGNDTDTTLSADELANITSGDISIEETTANSPSQDIPVDETVDFNFDTEIQEEKPEEGFMDIPEEDIPVESNNIEEASTEESFDIPSSDGEEEISLDDFGFDVDAPSSEDNSTQAAAEEPASEASGEEEISLDDFMDEGFSDESVASGNNGFEEGKGPSSNETEEISLDDFVDMSDFGMSSSPEAPKEEEIVEEAPLDMDISFDESADTVETEENVSVESDEEDDDDDSEEVSLETEEVSLDDFSNGFSSDNSSNNVTENIDTEDVDLSDFGIDAEAEETPIVQDVEESKSNDAIVDYDLSVGDENTAAAPVVNEIKSNNEEPAILEQEPIYENQTPAPGTENVSTSLLQQIVADLSGLKDEINMLKTNLAEIKAGEHVAAPVVDEPIIEESVEAEPVIEETVLEEPVVDEPVIEESVIDEVSFEETAVNEPVIEESVTEEPIAEEPAVEEVSVEEPVTDEDIFGEAFNNEVEDSENDGGFFGTDDTDETIALSGDELNNIFNSAEFNEVEAPLDNSIESDSVLPDEIPTSSETSDTDSEEQEDNADAFIEEEIDTTSEDLPQQIDFDASEEIEIPEEDVSSDEFDVGTDDSPLSDEIDEKLGTDLNPNEDISFDFENENLEEPTFEEEMAVDGDDESELPDEISIPKTDDILVETNNSDFMDSVKDSTETEQSSFEDEIFSDSIEEDMVFDTVDNVLANEESTDEAPAFEAEPAVEDETPAFEAEPAVEDEAPAFEVEPAVEDETLAFEAEPAVEDEAPAFEAEPVIEDEAPAFEAEPAVEDEAPAFEENSVIEEESPVFEESIVDEPVAENTERTFDEIDNLNNDLSDSNIDYLTTKEDIPEEELTDTAMPEANVNSDLKKDIKSVLLYMDQLLENLPEDKIIEFAKSDEFTTYKKLFSELGLS